MRHTFWSCLIRCANMKWIPWVLLKIQSGHDSVHRRTDGQMDGRTDGQTDKVIPVYPPLNFVEVGGIKMRPRWISDTRKGLLRLKAFSRLFHRDNSELCWSLYKSEHNLDGSLQERHNSIANALELCLSCTNPSIICFFWKKKATQRVRAFRFFPRHWLMFMYSPNQHWGCYGLLTNEPGFWLISL